MNIIARLSQRGHLRMFKPPKWHIASTPEVKILTGRLPYYISTVNMSSYEPNWQLQSLMITVNKDRFNERKQGLNFYVEFIDTCSHLPKAERNEFPLVLALPNSPGSHKDLLPLMEPLTYRGVRVVMLNFPGFANTRLIVSSRRKLSTAARARERYFYTHSTAERTEFIMGMLKVLEIETVDLAVGHATGAVPLVLLMNASDVVKSSLLLNPIPLHKPCKHGNPLWFIKLFTQSELTGIFRVVIQFITFVMAIWKKIPSSGFYERYNSFQVMTNVSFIGMPDYARRLAKKPCPISVAVSTKDPIIPFKDAKELLHLLDLKNENIHEPKPDEPWQNTYNKLNKRALIFQSANHYPQNNPVMREILFEEMIYLIGLANSVTPSKN